MKNDPRAPFIVTRNARAIVDTLAANRRGYTPEWTTPMGGGDAGLALNELLARYLEIQGDGVNAMPQRLELECLDSLGANVLPPQSARAPLVFKLLDTASGDATVPLGTRVAAVLPPPSPSLESDAAPKSGTAPEFFTEQEVTAMRGKLAAVYSIDPQADTYADHSAEVTSGFTVFTDMKPVPHRLYLGHQELFKLAGTAQIVLSFDFAAPRSGDAMRAQRPLLLDWEYLSTDGWQPLVLVEDHTKRFTIDGKVTIAKVHGPDSQEDLVGGQKGCWIRATVSNSTPGARIASGAAGYLVRYTPVAIPPLVQIGDRIGIAGATGRSTVLETGSAHVILDAALPAAAVGSTLETSDGSVIGTVLGAPAEYRLPVESTRDLLAGDIVTVDGSERAAVVTMDDAAIYLSGVLTAAQPGMIVELSDALPPLRPDGADEKGALPQVDLIRARVGFGKTGLPPDSAYLDGLSVDISKDFYPFGEQPARFAAFYVACKEAFTRNGARIELNFTYTQRGRDDAGAQVKTEYFDGSRWTPLGPKDDYVDGSVSLTRPTDKDPGFPHAKLFFTVPANWAESEVNGDKQRWLRMRLAAGDYGHPLALSVEADPGDNSKYIVKSAPSTLQPPIIARLAVNYLYFTNPQAPDYCVTENDFALADHSEDARWPRSPFAPFAPVSDRAPALHLGFSGKPPAALVSVLAQVLAAAAEGDPQPYAWDYWGSRGWTELSVRDATLGLRKTGLIQFVGAPDALPREGLGGALYRIRARLKSGLVSQDQAVQMGGVWLNAVWARQGQSVSRETLGISNGNPEQTFALPIVRAAKAMRGAGDDTVALNAADFERALDTPLAGVPVLSDEVVEVREWNGRGDDWQTVVGDVDPADLRFEADPREPTIKTAAWVRWKAQPHFYRTGASDRHYVVERARGVFRFPGAGGRIPPAGAPIVVTYVTGGGIDGNVPAGAVRELRSGVGFVQSVANPIAAGGGAAAETLRGARDRSAQIVRHRDRAVSFEDYEWLALSASSEVARVRALPLEGPQGRGARGFVGIVLVPHSRDAQPFASPELCRNVLAVLARRAPAGIAGGLRIVDPTYVPVGVSAEILPLNADEAGRVEARVRTRLSGFLHPLTGGHAGRGWDFGESVYLSDIAALMEETPGVDAVRFLQLMVGPSIYGDSVPVGPQQLIAAGDSQLKIIVPSSPYALA
jgi:hypothetical protein